jgi:N-acetyl-gamma-glutamyl-phosphate reductase
MVATITTRLTLDPPSARRILLKRYQSEPFVHILPEGVIPESAWVRGTNHGMINLFPREEGWYTLVAVLDNLGKGAASQAIQNANIRFGLPEETGLDLPPWFP